MLRAVPVLIAVLFNVNRASGQDVGRPESPDEEAVEARAETGYVILDGAYLAPPYVIRSTSQELTINGRTVRSPLPAARWPAWGGWRKAPGGEGFGAGGFGRGRGFGGARSGMSRSDEGSPAPSRSGERPGGAARGPARWMSPAWRVVRRLENEAILVAFEGQTAVFLDPGPQQEQFFEAVHARDPECEAFRSLVQALPGDADREVWSKWLAEIEQSNELWQRIDEVVRASAVRLVANESQIAATQRIQGLAYPLTVAGMVLGVLALGHLLRSFPQTPDEAESARARAGFVRATVISLALVVALSALDLVWTLLAAQAGQIRELNPLGSQWIDDPQALLAFKTAATLVGCGLLLTLRRHHLAQLAAWWLCLLCTVLTFRWVVFNSMFVA